MARCRSKNCLGWTLGENDRFCAWCGARLVELALEIHQRRDNRWFPLSPPLLAYDQRPELRLVIRNSGHCGALVIRPQQIHCSAAWLKLDTNGIAAPQIRPGEAVNIPVAAFKPPDGDSRHEAEIQVSMSIAPNEAPTRLVFVVVPRPGFELELPERHMQLKTDQPNEMPATLVLTRGRATVADLPTVEGGWAMLEWAAGGQPPYDLDAQSGQTRVPLKLRIRPEMLGDFQDNVMHRTGTVKVKCQGRDDAEAAIELSFSLAPELYVEPFRDRRRMDWPLVRGVNDDRALEITLYNGHPGKPGRDDLEIRSVRAPDAPWLRGLETLVPGTRIASGQALHMPLRIDPATFPAPEHVLQLTFETNVRTVTYFIKMLLQDAEPFNGWLVVDLGTSNTCAALIDENRALEMVNVDRGTTMPSVVGYQRLVSAVEYDIGSGVWSVCHLPDVAQSVVLAAKRRIGSNKPFAVVPEREPAETVEIQAERVLQHIYHRVVGRAMDVLASRSQKDVLITNTIVTHPSRFTMQQIRELKQAITDAMQTHLTRVPGPARSTQLRTLHEPLGAALHFLSDWRNQAPMHAAAKRDQLTYTLLVYDFGGGTIDITLLRITSLRQRRVGVHAGNGKAAAVLSDLVADEAKLMAALMAATWRRASSTGTDVPVMGVSTQQGSDVATANAFLLEQFCRSLMKVMPTPALLSGDDSSWQALRDNPKVNDVVQLGVQVEGKPQRLQFTRADLVPDVAEVRDALLGPPPESDREEDHPWHYTVTPEVIGATGHRWLGGEDVTAIVRELLIKRLEAAVTSAEKSDDVAFPVDAEKCPIEQTQSARQNQSQLRKWAEELKVQLSRGARPEEIAAGYPPTLAFWVKGKLKPYSVAQLMQQPPSLDEVYRKLEPELMTTITLARRLLDTHGVEQPDVLLRVGKASLLPLVPKLLVREFPQAKQVAPPEAKECVVQGACLQPLPGAGVVISSQAVRAGVRLALGPQQRLAATTSRVGIKVVDGARTWFQEMIGVGEPIPEDGLKARMACGLQPGHNVVVVLENSGTRDEVLFANGHPNPNIEEVGRFEVDLPDPLDDEVELELCVDADMRLGLRVWADGRKLWGDD
ncbi:MAG: Hsp70 family protein [Candidatus Xenobia bacterium]